MDNDEFSTSDMYFAAALMAYGAELKSLNKSDKLRQRFIFTGKISRILVSHEDKGFFVVTESPSFSEVKSKYDSNRLFLPPNYPDSVRKIKAAIHS